MASSMSVVSQIETKKIGLESDVLLAICDSLNRAITGKSLSGDQAVKIFTNAYPEFIKDGFYCFRTADNKGFTAAAGIRNKDGILTVDICTPVGFPDFEKILGFGKDMQSYFARF